MYCNMLDDVGSNLKINGQIFRATFWMLHDIVLVWPRSRNIVALGHARNPSSTSEMTIIVISVYYRRLRNKFKKEKMSVTKP